MTRKRKNTANRPSQSDQEYVTNSRGEKVRNVAYVPREKSKKNISATSLSGDFDSSTGLSAEEREELRDNILDIAEDLHDKYSIEFRPTNRDDTYSDFNYTPAKFAQYYSETGVDSNKPITVSASETEATGFTEWSSMALTEANYDAFGMMIADAGAEDRIELNPEVGEIYCKYDDYDDFVSSQRDPDDPRTQVLDEYKKLYDKDLPAVDIDLYNETVSNLVDSTYDTVEINELAYNAWKDKDFNKNKEFDPDDPDYQNIYTYLDETLTKENYFDTMYNLVQDGTISVNDVEDATAFEDYASDIVDYLAEHN